jgi:DHA1 family bicyclomycin/chloramphenicol resistance-like MFS transporter
MTLGRFAVLLRDRFFVGICLSAGLGGASMFAYISGATFVLQRIYGLSPQEFSFVFGLNSVGIVLAGQLGARLVGRVAPYRVLGLGLALNGIGALALATTVVLQLGLIFLIPSLFLMVSALGMVFPTASALALAAYRTEAGTASSLLGLSQFLAGAIAAPLVGIAGNTAVPLGVVALIASSSATLVFVILVRPNVRSVE